MTATILMVAAVVSAQQHPNTGINLSLWKNISTQRRDSTQNTFFNLGFVSSNHQLNGLGINILTSSNINRTNVRQVSGLANVNNGHTCQT